MPCLSAQIAEFKEQRAVGIVYEDPPRRQIHSGKAFKGTGRHIDKMRLYRSIR
jgi:hypothetical protein